MMNYDTQGAQIKVFGIGGGGNNAVNRMYEEKVSGIEDYVANVEYFVANTDIQALDSSPVPNKLVMGTLGAGSNPEVGRKAALDHENEIRTAMEGADMVYITAGMGGGTGTGAAPVFAKIARELGALTVGIVTTPFRFEGKTRNGQALEGLEELKKNVDSLIIVSNNRLLEYAGHIRIEDAFKEADLILMQGVQTVTDLIAVPAMINLDFADVQSVMRDQGRALIGIGEASGENAAYEAAKQAAESPLLEAQFKGARKAIINITGGPDITLLDAEVATTYMQENSGHNLDLDVIFGIMVNPNLKDKIIITIIATGFDDEETVIVPTQTVTATKPVDTVGSVNFVDDETLIPDFFKKR